MADADARSAREAVRRLLARRAGSPARGRSASPGRKRILDADGAPRPLKPSTVASSAGKRPDGRPDATARRTSARRPAALDSPRRLAGSRSSSEAGTPPAALLPGARASASPPGASEVSFGTSPGDSTLRELVLRLDVGDDRRSDRGEGRGGGRREAAPGATSPLPTPDRAPPAPPAPVHSPARSWAAVPRGYLGEAPAKGGEKVRGGVAGGASPLSLSPLGGPPAPAPGLASQTSFAFAPRPRSRRRDEHEVDETRGRRERRKRRPSAGTDSPSPLLLPFSSPPAPCPSPSPPPLGTQSDAGGGPLLQAAPAVLGGWQSRVPLAPWLLPASADELTQHSPERVRGAQTCRGGCRDGDGEGGLNADGEDEKDGGPRGSGARTAGDGATSVGALPKALREPFGVPGSGGADADVFPSLAPRRPLGRSPAPTPTPPLRSAPPPLGLSRSPLGIFPASRPVGSSLSTPPASRPVGSSLSTPPASRPVGSSLSTPPASRPFGSPPASTPPLTVGSSTLQAEDLALVSIADDRAVEALAPLGPLRLRAAFRGVQREAFAIADAANDALPAVRRCAVRVVGRAHSEGSGRGRLEIEEGARSGADEEEEEDEGGRDHGDGRGRNPPPAASSPGSSASPQGRSDSAVLRARRAAAAAAFRETLRASQRANGEREEREAQKAEGRGDGGGSAGAAARLARRAAPASELHTSNFPSPPLSDRRVPASSPAPPSLPWVPAPAGETVRAFCVERASRSGGHFRRFAAASLPALWREAFRASPPSSRHWYEIIRDSSRCHLYFDVEFCRLANPHVDGDALIDALVRGAREALREGFGWLAKGEARGDEGEGRRRGDGAQAWAAGASVEKGALDEAAAAFAPTPTSDGAVDASAPTPTSDGAVDASASIPTSDGASASVPASATVSTPPVSVADLPLFSFFPPAWISELDSSTPARFSRHLVLRVPGFAWASNADVGRLATEAVRRAGDVVWVRPKLRPDTRGEEEERERKRREAEQRAQGGEGEKFAPSSSQAASPEECTQRSLGAHSEGENGGENGRGRRRDALESGCAGRRKGGVGALLCSREGRNEADDRTKRFSTLSPRLSMTSADSFRTAGDGDVTDEVASEAAELFDASERLCDDTDGADDGSGTPWPIATLPSPPKPGMLLSPELERRRAFDARRPLVAALSEASSPAFESPCGGSQPSAPEDDASAGTITPSGDLSPRVAASLPGTLDPERDDEPGGGERAEASASAEAGMGAGAHADDGAPLARDPASASSRLSPLLSPANLTTPTLEKTVASVEAPFATPSPGGPFATPPAAPLATPDPVACPGSRPADPEWVLAVDLAVYTRNRHFRLIGCSKGGKEALLVPTARFAHVAEELGSARTGGGEEGAADARTLPPVVYGNSYPLHAAVAVADGGRRADAVAATGTPQTSRLPVQQPSPFPLPHASPLGALLGSLITLTAPSDVSLEFPPACCAPEEALPPSSRAPPGGIRTPGLVRRTPLAVAGVADWAAALAAEAESARGGGKEAGGDGGASEPDGSTHRDLSSALGRASGPPPAASAAALAEALASEVPQTPWLRASGARVVWRLDDRDRGADPRDLQALRRVAESVTPAIERLGAARAGGLPCRVRTVALCGSEGSVAYSMLGPGSHRCERIGRDHASNHVFFVVDLCKGEWAQKCYDPDCANWRSPWRPLGPVLGTGEGGGALWTPKHAPAGVAGSSDAVEEEASSGASLKARHDER